MPFWRRNRNETTPEREVDEPVDPDFVDPSWEPDPADFGDPGDGAETRTPADAPIEPEAPAERVDPLLPFEAPPPASMTIDDPDTASPRPSQPVPTWAEPVRVAEPAVVEPPRRPSRRPTSRPPSTPASSGPAAASWRASGANSGRRPAKDRPGTTSRRSLIAGDVGAALAIDLVERARQNCDAATPEAAIRTELAALLVARDLAWSPRSAVAGGPAVVLVVGVNGTGKTTTIGKLASRYKAEGRSVLLAAADTFRAAAIDQLRIWAERAKVPMVAHAPGADPGAVVYDALDAAVARGADLVIADTAGRLHTRSNLMDELSKVRRIIDKRLPGAEPETIFVLDATTGQNGLAQAKAFHEAVGLTGIVLTKLDSTAKGGIVFAIEDALEDPGPLRRGGGGRQRPDPVRPRRLRRGALRLTAAGHAPGGCSISAATAIASASTGGSPSAEAGSTSRWRTGENHRIAAPTSPPSGASHDVARSPIASASSPAPIVATSCARTAATWNVDETRPSARSRTSVWRTETSVMS